MPLPLRRLIPDRPYLKPWYRLANDDGRLLFEYAHSSVVLEGKAAEKLLPVLLPLLDGTRTVDEVAMHLGEAARPAVDNALGVLAEHDLLTEGPPLPGDTPEPVVQAAEFLTATGPGSPALADTRAALEGARAAVLGQGALAQEMARLLRLSGVAGVTLSDWPQSATDVETLRFAIVAPQPGDLTRMEQWNRLALEVGLTWLQVLPFDGHMAAVGPLYVPDDTCCFECYRRRRAANLDYGNDGFWALEKTPAAYPLAPPLGQIIAGVATTVALGWLAGAERSVVPALMHAIEWDGAVNLSTHHVYRVPRCPACSDVRDSATPSPWYE